MTSFLSSYYLSFGIASTVPTTLAWVELWGLARRLAVVSVCEYMVKLDRAIGDGVNFSTKIIIITHDLLLSFIDLFIICSFVIYLFVYLFSCMLKWLFIIDLSLIV